MKSKIEFETNISQVKVNFIDVEVSLNDGKLETNLYSKPIDAHLYLNAYSCHPKHTVYNIPKGQFIRIRRICSNADNYIEQGN